MGKNWSVSFEHDKEYIENMDLIIEDAIKAVENTSKDYYVNLVTPDVFGEPNTYLGEALISHFKDKIKTELIDQCKCGGYVLRVWKIK